MYCGELRVGFQSWFFINFLFPTALFEGYHGLVRYKCCCMLSSVWIWNFVRLRLTFYSYGVMERFMVLNLIKDEAVVYIYIFVALGKTLGKDWVNSFGGVFGNFCASLFLSSLSIILCSLVDFCCISQWVTWLTCLRFGGFITFWSFPMSWPNGVVVGGPLCGD